MEKILVMNGMSLLEFTFELMSGIYHLKNILDPVRVLLLTLSGPLVGHSGLWKYQCNTLACLYDIALAKVTQNWVDYPTISGRGWSETPLHNL